MERAASYKALGYGWADITRLLKIPYRTLMNWAKDPTFEQLLSDAKAEEVHLQRLARRVTVRQLEAGLKAIYSKEDAARAAERVLAPATPGEEGDYPAGGTAGGWYVEYPPRDQGLESKKTTEVLLTPAPAPAEPVPPVPPTKKGKRMAKQSGPPKRRRVAGPDE